MNLTEWFAPVGRHLFEAGRKACVELCRLVNPPKYTRDQRAYDEGWHSFRDDEEPVNRYPKGSDKYYSWQAGHDDSCSDSMYNS